MAGRYERRDRILLRIYLPYTGQESRRNHVFLYFPGSKDCGGIGTAVVGWLLEISGYVGKNPTHPASALTMLQVMYLWIPFIIEILITIVLSKMNVEATNEKIKKEKGIVSDCVTDGEQAYS